MRSALIAGSTGLVGGSVLALLLRDPGWGRIVAVGRRRPPIEDAKLESRILDMRLVEAERLAPIDQAFCALGTTIRKAGSQAAFREVDFDHVTAFARAAKKAGARAFHLVSSVGADAGSAFFYLQVKGYTEEGVKALGFEALHIYRPAVLVGERPESRALERLGILVLGALAPLMVGPLRRHRPVAAEAVASAMLAAAADPGRGAFIHESETF